MRTLAALVVVVAGLLALPRCTHAGREDFLDAYRAEVEKPCPCEKRPCR